MISRPNWGWFKPREGFAMALALHWTGLDPEFRYFSVNWLTRLNVSERALLHPLCICMIVFSPVMGYMWTTYSFNEFVELCGIAVPVDQEKLLQPRDELEDPLVHSSIYFFLVIVTGEIYCISVSTNTRIGKLTCPSLTRHRLRHWIACLSWKRRGDQDQNRWLQAWIPLDWGKAYLMLHEIEKSVEAGREFFHLASELQSPHTISRAYDHLITLENAGYKNVKVVQDFREELNQSRRDKEATL